MSNSREISQLSSFITVDNATKNIGITSGTTPFVGIGSTSPTVKLDVVGDANISGNVTAQNYYGSGANLTGVISGVGINSLGTVIGTGVTIINFIGVGNTLSYNSATNTVNITLPTKANSFLSVTSRVQIVSVTAFAGILTVFGRLSDTNVLV